MAPGIGVNLRVTGHCTQGGRKYMEDMFTVGYHLTEDRKDLEYAYFGIFDGHGGREAASFAKEHLLNKIVAQKDFWTDDDDLVIKAIRKGFLDTHEGMWNDLENWPRTTTGLQSTSGTTATVGFIKKGKLYVGHVGDSGIALGYQLEGEDEWEARLLTKEHKPEDTLENTRIVNSGGKVINRAGVPRVVWNRPRIGHSGPVRRSTHIDEIPFLAVARSLGDLWSFNAESNTYIVSPEPDTYVLKIDVKKHKCLIFGTDGLWNVVNPTSAVSVIQTCELHNNSCPKGNEETVWINPSQKLVAVALQRWAENQLRADNTSVVTLILDPPGPPRHDVLYSHSECFIGSHSSTTVNGLNRLVNADNQKNSTGVTMRDSMPLHVATPAEWVGPPPAAASFKREALWDLAYDNNSGTNQDRYGGFATLPSPSHSPGSEVSTGHMIRVIDVLECDPGNLPVEDDSSRRVQDDSNRLPVTLHVHIGNGDEHTAIKSQGFTMNVANRSIKRRHSTAGSPYQRPQNDLGTACGWEQSQHQRHRTLSENNPFSSQQENIQESSLKSASSGHSFARQWGKRTKARNLSGSRMRHCQVENKRSAKASKAVMSTVKRQSAPHEQSKEMALQQCRSTLEEHQGRMLRSTTAAIIEDSLPIAKKLRSSGDAQSLRSTVATTERGRKALRLAMQSIHGKHKLLTNWRKVNNARRLST